MEIRRTGALFSGGRVEIPVFDGAPGAARMNEFYAAYRAAVLDFAASLADSRRVWADCAVREDGACVTVVCTIRLRRRGRTEATLTLTHVWEDGLLVPPERRGKRKKTR